MSRRVAGTWGLQTTRMYASKMWFAETDIANLVLSSGNWAGCSAIHPPARPPPRSLRSMNTTARASLFAWPQAPGYRHASVICHCGVGWYP